MAAGRPLAVGLSYFPLDCHMDSKIGLIEAEFGLKGFAVIIKLYQHIYSELGYYCEWTPDISVLWAYQLGCTQGVGSGDVARMDEKCVLAGFPKNLINEIVAASIKRDIFSEELFQTYGILTSAGIQKRYLAAVSERKSVELKKEYLLIDVPRNRKNVVENSINRSNNSINRLDNEQRKVKESKKKKDIIVASPAEPEASTMIFTADSFEIKITDMLIQSCLEGFPNSKVPKTLKEKQKWAAEIEKMKRIDKRTEPEILQALEYATHDGVFWKTVIRSAKKFREKFETLYIQSKGRNTGKSTGKGSSTNKFNQFTQNDYDFDQLEQQLLSN